MQYLFPMKNIIPISHTDMHLDCVLSVVFPNTILYSRKRTHIEHNKYINKYTLHDIDDETDGILVTNFFYWSSSTNAYSSGYVSRIGSS